MNQQFIWHQQFQTCADKRALLALLKNWQLGYSGIGDYVKIRSKVSMKRFVVTYKESWKLVKSLLAKDFKLWRDVFLKRSIFIYLEKVVLWILNYPHLKKYVKERVSWQEFFRVAIMQNFKILFGLNTQITWICRKTILRQIRSPPMKDNRCMNCGFYPQTDHF